MKESASRAMGCDLNYIRRVVKKKGRGAVAVTVDKNQRLVPLLNSVDGVMAYTRMPANCLEEECLTMDEIMRQVEMAGLKRPTQRPARRRRYNYII